MNDTTSKPKKLSHIVPLRPDRFGQFQHTVQQFNAYVPAGTSRAEIEDGRYWAHVAGQVSVFSEIRVICEDGSYYAKLLIVFKNGTDIKLHCLAYTELDAVEELDEEGEFFVKSCGAVLGWCIVRRDDGHRVKEKMPTQAAALRELSDYLKALGR